MTSSLEPTTSPDPSEHAVHAGSQRFFVFGGVSLSESCQFGDAALCVVDVRVGGVTRGTVGPSGRGTPGTILINSFLRVM